MTSETQRLRSTSISYGGTLRPSFRSDSQSVLRRRSSSPLVWSPWRRADSVMERIMNPFLDRESPSYRCHYKPLPKPPSQPQIASDTSLLNSATAAKQFKAAEPRYRKSLAFHDGFHSTYVPNFPKGLPGLFVLVQSPLLLIAIGTFAGSVGLAMDMWSVKVAQYHQRFGDEGFVLFVLSACLAVSFSAILTHWMCPQAAGSGLPFMRVAISGIDMSAYLSFRCVATKIVGLMAALSAGLSIGKEGPFIMISCGFASILMNWRPFRRIRDDETKRLEMLACACAAGVAATFGSPFGGVLFGVEVTSHFYLVQTLPRSFFAAIVGALLVDFGTENTRYGLFGDRSMGMSADSDAVKGINGATFVDLCVFSIMGLLCGLAGALFNRCLSVLVRARDHFFEQSYLSPHRAWWDALGKRLGLVLVVTMLSCWLEFYGDSAWFLRHGSPRRILGALFSKDKHFFKENELNSPETAKDSLLLSRSLLTFLPLKFLLTLISIVLPVPAGLFTPTFVIGGIFGRLVGEAVRAFGFWHTRFEPFEFAIIGAGAFSSGVTHAVSTAAIIMEISHTDGLNLPVSVAILTAYFTAKRFSENVYDVLIATSHLPRLKKLPKAAYDIPAWEVMKDVAEMGILTADSTYGDALALLQRFEAESVFPIVDSLETRFLLATVTRSRLAYAVSRCQLQGMTTVLLSPANLWHPSNVETVATAATSLTRPRSIVPIGLQTLGDNSVIRGPGPAVCAMYGTMDSSPHNDSGESGDSMEVLDGLDEVPMLSSPIYFAFKRGGKFMNWGTNEVCEVSKLTVLIDPSPIQLMEMTPMRRVDMLFCMLKLNNVFVARSGKLMGVISLERMMGFLGTTTPYQTPGLWRTLKHFRT